MKNSDSFRLRAYIYKGFTKEFIEKMRYYIGKNNIFNNDFINNSDRKNEINNNSLNNIITEFINKIPP